MAQEASVNLLFEAYPHLANTGRRLLLVDDSVAFRERLARAFRDRGFEVTTAGNY